MASINYINNGNEHNFEMKPETLTALLNEYGNIENYLINIGVHYDDCDYEY